MPQVLQGSVSKEAAKIVKQMLMAGKAQAHISAILALSQASVSRIKSGILHPDVPWPSGSTGGMPIEQSGLHITLEWSEQANTYQRMPEELQVRIFECVNLRRASAKLPSLPEMAPEYVEYLEAQAEGEFEILRIEKAQLAEDRRITLLIQEFDEILQEDLAREREASLFGILNATREDRSKDEAPVRYNGTMIYTKLPWLELIERGSRIRIIQEAATKGDLALQEACCIGFHALRHQTDGWNSRHIVVEVRKIRERIAGDEVIMERLSVEGV